MKPTDDLAVYRTSATIHAEAARRDARDVNALADRARSAGTEAAARRARVAASRATDAATDALRAGDRRDAQRAILAVATAAREVRRYRDLALIDAARVVPDLGVDALAGLSRSAA